jgi:hypothetical protein
MNASASSPVIPSCMGPVGRGPGAQSHRIRNIGHRVSEAGDQVHRVDTPIHRAPGRRFTSLTFLSAAPGYDPPQQLLQLYDHGLRRAV